MTSAFLFHPSIPTELLCCSSWLLTKSLHGLPNVVSTSQIKKHLWLFFKRNFHDRLSSLLCFSKIFKSFFNPLLNLGGKRKLLLQLYKSLIRSKLDYGAPIFSYTWTPLKLLDSIQSSALRMAIGALRTSPTLSLSAEAGEPPLCYRFLSLNANFLTSTNLPIFWTVLRFDFTDWPKSSNSA